MPGEDQALAVEPILGSQLLDAAHQKEEPRCRASTGCTILDEAVLLGGFGYGDVNCLCAANEEEHGRDVVSETWHFSTSSSICLDFCSFSCPILRVIGEEKLLQRY